MKFNQLSAFEKHLESDPNHLSDVYLIVDVEPYVQKKLSLKIPATDESIERYDFEEMTLGRLREILETPSLFDPKKCVILEKLEKIPKYLEQHLLKYIENPMGHVRLVLLGNKLNAFCQKMSKRVVALDLTQEKPWERETRISSYLTSKLKREGIHISSALSQQIVKICGGSIAQLDQEAEKLICLYRGKGEVSREDLEFLLQTEEHSLFKIAEALIEKRVQDALRMMHRMKFPSILLLYTLRSFFQKSLRQKELPKNLWHQISPYLKGRMLEKSERQLQRISKSELKKMILTLFEIELLMKNQQLSDEFLQSLMLLKLQGLYEPIPV